jgi:lysophospholipase L1-like esterase
MRSRPGNSEPVRSLSGIVRRAIKSCGGWLLVLAISVALLEIALQFAVRLGYLNLSLPSYALETVTPFWLDINENFGVWHRPNVRYRHRKSCFDLVYSSNSYGMRYREVPLLSPEPRVVVLGDSFVEGFGVADNARLTEYLEKLTGIAHLNFGTSGDFGPTQSYLLYKTLASKFDHQAVIFMLFPQNDFLDDLPAPPRLRRGARYRPYLVGKFPDYVVTYPPGGLPADHQLRARIESMLLEFSLVARATEFATMVVRQTVARWRRGESLKQPTSFYFDYTPEEFNRLRYALTKIKEIAGERPVLLASIALPHDYAQAAAQGTPPLRRQLNALATDLNITFIDLGEHMTDAMDNYLSCDFHWAEQGHRRAAEVIAKWNFYHR